MTRECTYCGGEFTPDHHQIRTCSVECQRLRKAELRREQNARAYAKRRLRLLTCPHCDGKFTVEENR